MQRRAFVTGATGFLGRHVVEQLTQGGWEVTVFHRAGSQTDQLKSYGSRLVTGRLDDRASIAAALPGEVDAVFHVAGNTSFWAGDGDQQYRDNVEGTRNVVAAAVERRARCLVHTSTESVWGQPETEPIEEAAPKHGGQSWIGYERTKFLAEEEVRAGIQRGLRAVFLNPAHIVGRYDERSWGRSFRLVKAGKLPGVPPGRASWCSAEEVAKAHVAAVDRGGTGENYLLGGHDATYLEVFQEISRLVGAPLPQRTIPRWALYAGAADLASRLTKRAPEVTPELAHVLSDHRTVRSDKAMRELSFRAVPVQALLRECFDWLQSEGRL